MERKEIRKIQKVRKLIKTLVAAVVEQLAEAGAEVFIIPAMGSHGGATAEGQIQVLHDLGITPANVGVPIK